MVIGVFMVVDVVIIVNDVIDFLFERFKNEIDRLLLFYMFLESIFDEDRFNFIKEVIFFYYGNFFVILKDIDRIVENILIVIVDGINKVIYLEVKENDEYRYVN